MSQNILIAIFSIEYCFPLTCVLCTCMNEIFHLSFNICRLTLLKYSKNSLLYYGRVAASDNDTCYQSTGDDKCGLLL